MPQIDAGGDIRHVHQQVAVGVQRQGDVAAIDAQPKLTRIVGGYQFGGCAAGLQPGGQGQGWQVAVAHSHQGIDAADNAVGVAIGTDEPDPACCLEAGAGDGSQLDLQAGQVASSTRGGQPDETLRGGWRGIRPRSRAHLAGDGARDSAHGVGQAGVVVAFAEEDHVPDHLAHPDIGQALDHLGMGCSAEGTFVQQAEGVVIDAHDDQRRGDGGRAAHVAHEEVIGDTVQMVCPAWIQVAGDEKEDADGGAGGPDEPIALAGWGQDAHRAARGCGTWPAMAAVTWAVRPPCP